MASRESLKKLLKKARLEKPSLDFTASVMEGIRTYPTLEDVRHPRLARLMKGHGLVSPPSNFTFNTMRGLERGKAVVKPLITSWTWCIIIAVTSLFAIMVVFSENSSTKPGGITRVVLTVGEFLSKLFNGSEAFGSLVLMMVIAVAGLLLLDWILRTGSDKLGSGNQ